jgi:hypothetical protein
VMAPSVPYPRSWRAAVQGFSRIIHHRSALIHAHTSTGTRLDGSDSRYSSLASGQRPAPACPGAGIAPRCWSMALTHPGRVCFYVNRFVVCTAIIVGQVITCALAAYALSWVDMLPSKACRRACRPSSTSCKTRPRPCARSPCSWMGRCGDVPVRVTMDRAIRADLAVDRVARTLYTYIRVV